MGFANTPVDVIQNDDVGATAQLVRTGQMIVRTIQGRNSTAALAFIQMFNAAAAADVTVGTTVPRWVIPVLASSVNEHSGIPDAGMQFPLGLVVACTTTPGGNTGATMDVATGV